MARQKPTKPTPDFPLFPHDSGQWAKKIKGKLYYFGVWDLPEAALKLYKSEQLHLEAGINPRTMISVPVNIAHVGLRISDGINLFLDHANARVERGELSKRSFKDYTVSGAKVLEVIDRLRPINLMQPRHWGEVYNHLAAGKNATTIGNEITRVRVIFSWLRKNHFIDREPYYGTSFSKPSKSQSRKAKSSSGRTWFDASEIKLLVANARPSFKAMIYLGVNCGLGNSDCAQLETGYLNLESGWMDYPRPKTGVNRRAKLWPETIEAIQGWIAVRPKIKKPILFVTRIGNAWSDPDSSDCQIAKCFREICKEAGVHSLGRGFYGLRRTCETIGGESKDQVAVDFIMGHIDHSMGGVYRQRISDERLQAVSDTIRDWMQF